MKILPLNNTHINKNHKDKFKARQSSMEPLNEIVNLNDNPIGFYNKTQINFNGKLNLNQCKNYTLDNYCACLLGGAIGDAFGAPVEFMNMSAIKIFYGLNGVEELECNDFGVAEFTDDTQMTIFTADGILKSLANKTNINENVFTLLNDIIQFEQSTHNVNLTQLLFAYLFDICLSNKKIFHHLLTIIKYLKPSLVTINRIKIYL
jgi:hypothetical protein